MSFFKKHYCGIFFITSFIAMLWGFNVLILQHAPDVFQAQHEDMSFGWFVPIFSLYVLWSERRKILESVSSPSIAGFLCSLPFLVLGFLGVRGAQVRLEIFAFAGLVVTLTWTFFGRRTAKETLFPAMFLLFCMPLATFLDIVTVHLRYFASSTAFHLLNCFGADLIQRGTSLAAADGSYAIDVADPCSGLRSLFALMALTAGYSYFNQPTWVRRGILFALSIPLAILGNVFRIVSICVVAAVFGGEFAVGYFHDYSGFVVFAVAISLMVASGSLISVVWKECFPEKEECARANVEQSLNFCFSKFSFAVSVFCALAFISIFLYQSTTPEVTLAEPPEVSLCEFEGYQSEELEPSEAELTILPRDTVLKKRLYTGDDGWFLVSAVIGGRYKSSIHRPELCLPAQGYKMEKPRTLTTDSGKKWRVINISSSRGRSVNYSSNGFMYFFYNQEGFRTPSHVARISRDIWDRSILNRIDRWVMVTVTASSSDDARLKKIAAMLERSGVFK
jgi:exosortase